MADYAVCRVEETRIEYRLKLPTNWVEVSKVFAAARQALGREEYDDDVTVTSTNDEFLVFALPATRKVIPE